MPTLQHSFIRANNLGFHVAHVEQDAPLVLFLHGFPEFWYSWRHQIAATAVAGYRVWAPDLRGYNLTDKPQGIDAVHLNVLTLDVLGLLEAARVDKVLLVGHDWGGLIAWRFAMDYPERVAKLVVLNLPHPGRHPAGLRMPRQLLRSWYIGALQIPWLPERFIASNPRLAAETIRRTAVQKQAFSDADIAAYAHAIAQPGAMRAAVNYYRSWFRSGFFLPVKQIDVPTLLIWGEQDVALEKALTRDTARWVPDFRIHYIPRSGHWVQNEAADEVNEQLVSFLSSERA